MNKQNKIIIGLAVIIVVIVIFLAAYNVSGKNKVSVSYDKFAQCLAEKGAVMYGAEWCSHCKAQKAVFGNSFKYVNYVECPDNTQLCIDKGVQGFPTWLVGTSTKIEGFDENKTMKALSDATGCPLP